MVVHTSKQAASFDMAAKTPLINLGVQTVPVPDNNVLCVHGEGHASSCIHRTTTLVAKEMMSMGSHHITSHTSHASLLPSNERGRRASRISQSAALEAISYYRQTCNAVSKRRGSRLCFASSNDALKREVLLVEDVFLAQPSSVPSTSARLCTKRATRGEGNIHHASPLVVSTCWFLGSNGADPLCNTIPGLTQH